METIELEPGWLELQMEKVKKEVEAWPEEVKQLRHINSSLVIRPTTVKEKRADPPNKSFCNKNQ